MTTEGPDDSLLAAVDDALQAWRQGDCVLAKHWFAFGLDIELPVTPAARNAAEDRAALAEQQVVGFVVVTQTCDIVRACLDKPFVEISPLVEVNNAVLVDVERGRRPAFGFLPALASQNLVADLDRTMTIEKPIVTRWARTPGCLTDADVRDFAAALARKKARFAFPDDFVRLVEKLRKKLVAKHGKSSPEGEALRALREIRIHASPSWDDEAVRLNFLFIRDVDEEAPERKWDMFCDGWLELVKPGGRFVTVDGYVTTLDDMRASDYVYSDPLDLDHLSGSDSGA